MALFGVAKSGPAFIVVDEKKPLRVRIHSITAPGQPAGQIEILGIPPERVEIHDCCFGDFSWRRRLIWKARRAWRRASLDHFGFAACALAAALWLRTKGDR